jgi:LytS/YehU family sensor histidine kinase
MRKTGFLINDLKIDLLAKYSLLKLLFASMIFAVFIIYPNFTLFQMQRAFLREANVTPYLLFFIFTYFYFSLVIWILIIYNLRILVSPVFAKRLLKTFFLIVIAFFLNLGLSYFINPKKEYFTSLLILQFFVIFLFASLIGHVSHLYSEKRKKDLEIEQLKIENLQSRCEALTNQINPHFFFNSLNGLAALIRKKNDDTTFAYLNKLSDVFRYILQSEKKGLVTLEEELDFVQAFRYMMEIRFANKLIFDIKVDEDKKELKIPVLSLLPVIENVIVHNTIDSEHKMLVTIFFNDKMELVVSNPVFPKLTPPDTNGTGLKNLENRFLLLMDRHIRIENDGNTFSVYLPMK